MGMSLNWKKEWLLPYESPWSIIEKIKFTNKVSTRDFLKIFGTAENTNIRSGFIGKRKRDLWGMEGIDDKLLSKDLGFSIKEHTENCVTQITKNIPRHIPFRSLFREELSYCLDCMKKGYHSLFHQLGILYRCPYHGNELTTQCSKCGATLQYAIPGHNFELGFVCLCGECLLDDLNITFQPKLEITDRRITTFLNNSYDDLRLENTYIFRSSLVNDREAIKHLLDMNNFEMATCQCIIRRIVRPRLEINRYDELYECARQTIKAFEAMLFKTVLKKHKHCIKRFTGLIKRSGEEFPAICPYAYAYIFWKDTFLNINPFYNDIGPIKKKKFKDS
jgi:hypothetical protein